MIRDSSLDVNDPDASMTDPSWHRSYIKAKDDRNQCQIVVTESGLRFERGFYDYGMLKMIVKPTMKGFWIPVSVGPDATFNLNFPELIGLQNCSPHFQGALIIRSNKMKSFELSPIKSVDRLYIGGSPNLTDLKNMPSVSRSLGLESFQVKDNLKNLIYACDKTCFIKLEEGKNTLASILNYNVMKKGSHHRTLRQIVLQAQADLIDHDLDEYAEFQ